MTIFLAGAGPDPLAFPEVFDRFANAAGHRAGHGRRACITVAVHPGHADLPDAVAAYTEPLHARIECDITVVSLESGRPADPGAFAGADG
ncbi:MAG: hypothetical protein ACLGH7_06605, partial [Actinomycetes bacterium]